MEQFFYFYLYCAMVAAVLTILWKCVFDTYAQKREAEAQIFIAQLNNTRQAFPTEQKNTINPDE
jgi:hypothetical protein